MKTEELKNKSKEELHKSVIDLKKKLADLRFKFSSNKLKNVKEINQVKKEIARMLTVLSENKSEARSTLDPQGLPKPRRAKAASETNSKSKL